MMKLKVIGIIQLCVPTKILQKKIPTGMNTVVFDKSLKKYKLDC